MRLGESDRDTVISKAIQRGPGERVRVVYPRVEAKSRVFLGKVNVVKSAWKLQKIIKWKVLGGNFRFLPRILRSRVSFSFS